MKFFIVFLTVLATVSVDVLAILKGQSAAKNQFPFLAQIVVTNQDTSQRIGAGSVITKKHIVTAASLVFDASGVEVYVGSNKINDPSTQHYTVLAFSIRIHDLFDSKTKHNDIAVIQLFNELTFSPNVQPIKLATLVPIDMYVNTKANVVGAGLMGDTPANTLQYVQMNMISIDDFELRTRQPIFDMVTKDNLFAFGLDNDKASGPCANDDGAPLVTGTGADMTLIGIYSRVDTGNCQVGRPSVYTSVAIQKAWIAKNTRIFS